MKRCARKWQRAVSRPDADALRFAIAAEVGDASVAADRFGIAVSGGPDSVALLLLAQAAFGSRMMAATVNHRMRAEAADEAAWVAKLCAERGIAHHILSPDDPPAQSSQQVARTLRYALLEDWRVDHGIDWLVTAHHADDQLETMVMRLNRGSGTGGLAGIRARNDRILRPLLSFRREALAGLVTAAGITPVNDPSNRDARYDRARLRAAIGDQRWLDPVAAAQSAAHLAQAEAALDWSTAQVLAERARIAADGSATLHIGDLPEELLFRATVQLLSRDAAQPPRGREVHQLIMALRDGKTRTLNGWQVAQGAAKSWHFRRLAQR